MDPDSYQEMSDAESLSSRHEVELLAESSKVTETTGLVQSGAFPLLYPQGDILPSPLVVPGYSVDDSIVTLGIDPKSDENLPEPESEEVVPSITLEGEDDPHNEEGMDVLVETGEEEQPLPSNQ